jgi:magnesium transporter
MTKVLKKVSEKKGMSPGSLVYVGEEDPKDTKISIIDYNKDELNEKITNKIKDCLIFKNNKNVSWLQINGLKNTELIKELGKYYDIHHLILEDILNTNQRPKIEIFDNYIFTVLNILNFDKENNKIISEQISLILGKNFVISFLENENSIFDLLKTRIKNKKSILRNSEVDFLFYAILDTIIDNYFVLLENFNDKLEEFDEQLISEPKSDILKKIYNLKREILFLRKSVWPLRELILKIEKSNTSFIRKKTYFYFRDLYDHVIHIIDIIEINRDLLSGMLDLYLSTINNKMNEVMKVLTIIATIFIPLTFIAGVYGMNFENMPELTWGFGYYGIMLFMFLIASFMLYFFKRKKWF